MLGYPPQRTQTEAKHNGMPSTCLQDMEPRAPGQNASHETLRLHTNAQAGRCRRIERKPLNAGMLAQPIPLFIRVTPGIGLKSAALLC